MNTSRNSYRLRETIFEAPTVTPSKGRSQRPEQTISTQLLQQSHIAQDV